MEKLFTQIIREVTQEELPRCFPVMHQLRPHLDEQTFVEQVRRQMAQGYRLASLVHEEEVKAVTGFRMLEFLAWGKVLYIDDLVTCSSARGKGYGSALLKWVLDLAKEAECDQVHLDSGPQRHDAHRLYLNHGFKIIGYHFAKSIP